MKIEKIYIVIVILFSFGYLKSQDRIFYDFDTIFVEDNKVFVNTKCFQNNNLISESQMFLIPVTLRVPKYRFFGNLIEVNIEADSIVRHGLTIEYFENRLMKKIEYINGEEIYRKYYSDLVEITSDMFYKMNIKNTRTTTDQMLGEYFIKGKKVEKN